MLGKDAMFGEQIKDLQNLEPRIKNLEGKVEHKDIRQDYINRLLSDLCHLRPDTRIAWDAANGAMGEILEIATQGIKGEHFCINTVIDGSFPAHPADPTKLKNNEQLITLLKQNKCDVGFGFDGDGDRLGIIDDKGRMINGDQILAILARDVLAENPNAPIIADIKSSRLFEQEVTRLGGKPILWKTGHSLIKSKMKEMQAPLAGEMSAHIFFADKYYGYDDSLYAAIRFLNVMQSSGMKASELLDSLPVMHSSPEFRVAYAEERKFAVIEEIKAELQAKGVKFSDIDGIRVDEPEGWWLIRASNTGAELVIRYEAETKNGFEKLTTRLEELLGKYQIILN